MKGKSLLSTLLVAGSLTLQTLLPSSATAQDTQVQVQGQVGYVTGQDTVYTDSRVTVFDDEGQRIGGALGVNDNEGLFGFVADEFRPVNTSTDKPTAYTTFAFDGVSPNPAANNVTFNTAGAIQDCSTAKVYDAVSGKEMADIGGFCHSGATIPHLPAGRYLLTTQNQAQLFVKTGSGSLTVSTRQTSDKPVAPGVTMPDQQYATVRIETGDLAGSPTITEMDVAIPASGEVINLGHLIVKEPTSRSYDHILHSDNLELHPYTGTAVQLEQEYGITKWDVQTGPWIAQPGGSVWHRQTQIVPTEFVSDAARDAFPGRILNDHPFEWEDRLNADGDGKNLTGRMQAFLGVYEPANRTNEQVTTNRASMVYVVFGEESSTRATAHIDVTPMNGQTW